MGGDCTTTKLSSLTVVDGWWLYNNKTELTNCCWWVVTMTTKLSSLTVVDGWWLYDNKTELTHHYLWAVTLWRPWWGVPQQVWLRGDECPPSVLLSRLHTSESQWWMSSVRAGRQPLPGQQEWGGGHQSEIKHFWKQKTNNDPATCLSRHFNSQLLGNVCASRVSLCAV